MTQIKIKRHIAKAISYRIIGTLQTFVVGYILTGNFLLASSIGIVEIFIKPLIYFLHERVWYKWIKFGVVESKIKKEKKIIEKLIPDENFTTPLPNNQKKKKVLNYSNNR